MAETPSTGAGGASGPGGKPAGKDAQRRKLLIYGGLAAVMLLVVMMSRKSSGASSSSSGSDTSAAPDSALDGSDPTDDGGDVGGGAGGVDDSADLGNIDSDLQELSQQIAGEQTNATTPGDTASTLPYTFDPSDDGSGGPDPTQGGLIPMPATGGMAGTTIYRTTVKPGPGGGAAAKTTRPTTKPRAPARPSTSRGRGNVVVNASPSPLLHPSAPRPAPKRRK